MSRATGRNLEHAVAKGLKGKNFTCKKIKRDTHWISAPDDEIPELPELKIDAKYRKRFAFHVLFEEIERKYCKNPEDKAVMPTKRKSQRGFLITIRYEFFNELLDCYIEVNKKE